MLRQHRDTGLSDPRHQHANHLAQAVPERHEHGPGRRSVQAGRRGPLAAGQHPADEAAILPLHLEESGKGRFQTDLFGVAGVNPGHQGLDDAFKGLASESATEEGGQRLITGRSPRRKHQVHGHPRHSRPRQEPAPEQRSELRRRDDHQSFRQLPQAAARIDIGLLLNLVGVHQTVRQPQLRAQVEGPRLVGQE